MNQQF